MASCKKYIFTFKYVFLFKPPIRRAIILSLRNDALKIILLFFSVTSGHFPWVVNMKYTVFNILDHYFMRNRLSHELHTLHGSHRKKIEKIRLEWVSIT